MFTAREQFEKIAKQNVEAVLAAAEAQFGALEKLASLNLELAKSGFAAWANNSRALVGVKDTEELVRVQTAAVQPDLQPALDYWRRVYGLATEANAEMLRIAERRFAESGAQAEAAVGGQAASALAKPKKAA